MNAYPRISTKLMNISYEKNTDIPTVKSSATYNYESGLES